MGVLSTACQNSSGTNQPVGQPITSSPATTAFKLQLSGQVDVSNNAQFTLNISGGQGAVNAILKFHLPEGAELTGARTSNGAVQVVNSSAFVISPQSSPTVVFDVRNLPAGNDISVELIQAASNDKFNSESVTVKGRATPTEGSFQPVQFQDAALQLSNLRPISSLATDINLKVPTQVKREWLPFELGDINRDGKINLLDTVLLTEVLLKLNNKTLDEGQRFNADFKDDLAVDYNDLGLLALKQLDAFLGIKRTVPSVHPKTILVAPTPQLLTVRNADAGPNTMLVNSGSDWLMLRRVTTNVHEKTLAYEVLASPGVPANATSTITVTGSNQSRQVSVAVLPPVNTTPASETYTVQPGQTVTGLDGVQVVPPASWVPQPNVTQKITIERIDPRTTDYPLPSGVRQGLPIYRVTADPPMQTTTADRFKVILPVGSANAEYLAPLRLSFQMVESDDGDTTRTVWQFDPSAQRTSTQIVFQTTGFTLDTHLFTAMLIDQPSPIGARLGAQQVAFENSIVAVCPTLPVTNSSGAVTPVAMPCTATAQTLGVQWTSQHAGDFKTIFGFTDADLDAVLTREIYLIPSSISAGIYNDTCTIAGVRGYYDPNTSHMVLCTTANAGDVTDNTLTYTVRHELMHAMQWRIQNWGAGTARNWILEGTARASEGSTQASMGLSPRSENILRIDQPFNTSGSTGAGFQRTYAHQDFWVYLGQRAGQGLPYLRPIFQQGIPSPVAGVSSAIGANTTLSAAGITSLGTAYWEFAKNQAIEHSVALRTADSACVISTTALTPTNVTLDFKTLKAASYTGSLQPLQSAGYTFKFSGMKGDGDKTMAALSSKLINDKNDIRVAVYLKKTGTYSCPGQELTLGDLKELKVASTSELFVLVSNISTSTTRNFKFELEKGKLEELTPVSLNVELDVDKTKDEPFSFKNAGLAKLDYEIKVLPQGNAGTFSSVTIKTPALTGSAAAATLKADETADPFKQDGTLTVGCVKQTDSPVQWKLEFHDRAVDSPTPAAELNLTVTCKDLRPPLVQKTGSGEEKSTSGDDCRTTTTYRPWATYSVTLPSGLSPEVKIKMLSDNQGKSTSTSPWVLNGKLYSGTHSVTGTLQTETASATSEPLAITVPPVRTETKTHDCGGNAGDPHLMTLDGQRYSFQGVGEYVFTRTPDRAFEVQMRFHQMGEQGSANSAIAMNVAGDRVGFYALGTSTTTAGMAMMRVNGAEIPVALTSIQSLTLSKGGQVDITPEKVKVTWPDGNFVSLRWRGEFFDFVTVGVLPEYRNRLEGLLGNDSRNTADDYRGRDGTQYTNPPSFEQLYKGFGDSWRIRQDESLFDYGPGQSTTTFTRMDFPPAPIPFTPQQVSQAEAQCSAAGVTTTENLQNCIFDVANTISTNPDAAAQLAQAAANADPAHPSASISPSWSEVIPGGQILLGAVITGNADANEVTWQADSGTIVSNGNGTATFTAPLAAGQVRVKATLRGENSQAIVEVRSGLIQGPQELQVFESNATQVSVHLVGSPSDVPLTWTATRGQVTGIGTSVTYTAPTTSGEDNVSVQVTDKPETRVTIPIKVLTPTIRLSPQSITLYSGDSVGLNALLAGFTTAQNLTWSSSGGTLNAGLGAATYTAPITPGTYTVTATITSRPELQAKATITVLRIDPVAALSMPTNVHAGERFTVSALNADGSPYIASPLQWSTNSGSITSQSGNTALITIGNVAGSFTVTATPVRLPTTPTILPITVVIETPVLRFINGIAASAIVPVNQQVTVVATRANGAPYPLELDWTATGGAITSTINTATFTAGAVTGDYQITATPRVAPSYMAKLPLRVVQRITGETRFILTWGASPSDLDTHLWLPASTPYHVYYARRGIDSVCPFAQLDQDDTDAYGPEVMRVKGLTGSSGVYSLQIHNYSQAGTFTQSQAQVQVVSTATGEVLTTVTVPAGDAPGLWWNVLTFDAATGVINVVNTVGDLTEPYLDTASGCSITTTPMQPLMLPSTKPAWQPGVPFRH